MKYQDQYGDIWLRSGGYVIRQKDGNIGGWFDGNGLIELTQDSI